ncbi:MAG: D-glycero-alpha-D-manno-heptose-7-phosphate kinase [Verrucomicrobiota bacterium]|jgi:D-glycero-alpha-D-manno-heptose-7-phosphate kinase
MENAIVTRAPTRIDFGGGWTDVPPYSDEMGGYVCNLAISRFATVTVSSGPHRFADSPLPLADRSIAHAAARRFGLDHASITVRSEFPVGAGLGGSSAVGVAAVAACAAARGETMAPDAMAELSREIEIADMEIPGGRQDHYAAAYGGALGLRFSAGRVDVRPLPLSPQTRTAIEQRGLIIYTGQSRNSGDTITAVLDAYRDRQPETLAALERMRQLAQEMADTLLAGDLDTLGALVAEHWQHQRSLHPAIPTPAIDEIIARAQEAGAIGAKALGASGGGCVLVITRADRTQQVRDVVASLGEVLPFSIAPGVKRCQ